MSEVAVKKRIIEKKYQYYISEHKSELEKLKATKQIYEKRRIGKKSLITDEYSLHWRHTTNALRENIVRENQATYRRKKLNKEYGEKEGKKLFKLITKFPRLSELFPNQFKSQERKKSKFPSNPLILFSPQDYNLLFDTPPQNQADDLKKNVLRLPLGNANWFLNDSAFYHSDETFFAETLAKIHANVNYSFSSIEKEETKNEETSEESEVQSSHQQDSHKHFARNTNKESKIWTNLKFPPLFYAVEKIKRQKIINEKNGLYMLDPIMKRDLERPRFPTLELKNNSF